jgi:ribosomal protein L11 methyltransferase
MRWIEAAFKTTSEEIDTLCDRLTELGAESLVIEDETDFKSFLEKNRQYWDYVDEELEKRYAGVSRVKLYASDDEAGQALISAMTEALGIEPETVIVDDADWQDNWKAYYKPVEVGETLLILPQWEPIPLGSKKRLLRLDPGLAFGTGGHARPGCAFARWKALRQTKNSCSTSAAAAASWGSARWCWAARSLQAAISTPTPPASPGKTRS